MPRRTKIDRKDIGERIKSLPEPDLDDPDNPEWTKADFAGARAPEEALPPEVLAAFPRTAARVRGRQKAPTKKQVTLRLDPDVLAHFQAAGPGWQSRINAALRRVIRKAT